MIIVRRLHRKLKRRIVRRLAGLDDVILSYDWSNRIIRNISIWSNINLIYGMGEIPEHVRLSRLPSRMGITTSCEVFSSIGDWRHVLFENGKRSVGRTSTDKPKGVIAGNSE